MSITFYRDMNYQGASFTYYISEHAMDAVVVLPQMRDDATSVKWSLPAGVVVTLMDDVAGSVADIHKSRTFDCVGTGQFDLKDIMNDCISAVYATTYDSRLGYVEVYDDINYSGNRTFIFPSKFNNDQLVSIAAWRQQDGISSIKWSNLGELTQMIFYDKIDGSGNSFSDAFGWNSNKGCADLRSVLMNDCISAFKWSYRVPKKEVVQAVSIVPSTPMTITDTFYDSFIGYNASTNPIVHSLTIDKELTSTTSCTVSNSNTFGWNVSATVSYTPPNATGGIGGSVTVGFNGASTTSTENTSTTTTTMRVTTSTSVTAAAQANYYFVYSVAVGTVPSTTFSTTADRWYDIPVSGAVKDPSNSNWYKRTETLSGSFAGGYATQTTLATK